MEWLLDPTVWVGLALLVSLEIVLAVDNLVLVAILADRLPSKQRERVRVISLSLGLGIRLLLLGGVAWLLQFTSPLMSVGSVVLSVSDLILICGGLFLILKSTVELHERFTHQQPDHSGKRVFTRFGLVLAQIVVLDAFLSLDAVMTAIGLVEHLSVMMVAIVVAAGVTLLASKSLMDFVKAHPSVVVLCLSFLLLIGFALIAEGFGFVVPKEYLYVAIIFSMAVQLVNTLTSGNRQAVQASGSLRERTADSVLRLLGHRPPQDEPDEVNRKDRKDRKDRDRKERLDSNDGYGVEERNMVSGVLTLADRTVRSIMTPRTDVSWINIDDDPDVIRQQIENAPHSFFPVCRDNFDNIIGVGRAKRMITDLLTHGHIREKRLREPLVVHDTISIIRLIDTLKKAKGQLVLVANEFGTLQGLATPIDVFEAIAGEFPDENETPDIVPDGEHRWRIDGAADLHLVEQVLETDGLVNEDEDYTTLAGYLLNHFGQLPSVGDSCALDSPTATVTFRVVRLERRRIAMVHVEKHPKTDEMPTGESA